MWINVELGCVGPVLPHLVSHVPPQVPSSSVWKSQLRRRGCEDCPLSELSSLLSQREIARFPLTCSCHNPHL